jgi:predicted AlkP superfamily pyrophosphatase or phosphodiesterase
MKKFLLACLLLVLAISVFAQSETEQRVIPGRKNDPSQENKPYVILISADGFRWDYAEKYKAKNLLALANDGVKAESMIPSYPSVTFPNHYTLVTGLYPSHQGLVNNGFYDRNRRDFYSMSNKAKVGDGSWYGGTPLWVLAEQQHMLAASFYWVASEAKIKEINQTYYYLYNDKIPMSKRIETVVDWLKLPADRRPHFITFYIPDVDHAGHTYGPDARETWQAVNDVDHAVGEMVKAVKTVKTTGLNVNFIFVADHGMTNIDQNTIITPRAVDTSKFVVSGDGILVELYAKNKADVQGTYDELKKEAENSKHYKVYLSQDVPAYLHYNKSDDRFNRIGDILLIPTWPKVFSFGGRRPSPGTHGFDSYQVKDMHATFFAWGPAFKQHLVIPSFPNVDVFPMMADILGLTVTEPVDGTQKLANEILVKP